MLADQINRVRNLTRLLRGSTPRRKSPRRPREAWREHEKEEAKKRHAALSGRPSDEKPKETFPWVKGQARDKIGQRVGVSGKSIDKAGEMLAEMELNPGSKNLGVGGNTMLPPKLADLGITKMQSSRWRSVANEAPPAVDHDYARATVISCGIDRCG
jgi:hypothetical protein